MSLNGFYPWFGKIPWRREWQFQYSCLENSMDRGVWQGNIHTYLMFTLHTVFIGALKKKKSCRQILIEPWSKIEPWRRKWQPTPGFVPGKPHGRRRLVGYSPWGCKESDTTERLHPPPFLRSKLLETLSSILVFILYFPPGLWAYSLFGKWWIPSPFFF